MFNALGLLKLCADQVLHSVFSLLLSQLDRLNELDLDEFVEVEVGKLRHEHDFDVTLVGFALGGVGKAIFKPVHLEVRVG